MIWTFQLAHAINFFQWFGYKTRGSKIGTKLLNFEQKQLWMEVAQESLNKVCDDMQNYWNLL